MAYLRRGRGPRTRGGVQRGRISDNVLFGYGRSDGNMFSCLRGLSQDGGDQTSSDSDEAKSDKSESLFQEVRTKKKRKLNSSSGGGSKFVMSDEEDIDYQTISTEEKLNLILSKVSLNERRFRQLEHMLDGVVSQEKHISKLNTVVSSHEDRIRLLEYKSIDIEARSRRNNLLFYGLREVRGEDCKNIISQFVSDRFEIVISENAINKSHRVGRYSINKTRPIIVAFQDYSQVERIIKSAHMLRDSQFSVSRDYPLEITRARRTLWPDYKQYKTSNPSAKVAIVYPAKLLVNGNVVQDLFPEWDTLLSGSRIDLRHPSQQSQTSKTGFKSVTTGALQSTPRIGNEITQVKTSHVERMEFNNQNDNTQDFEVQTDVQKVGESKTQERRAHLDGPGSGEEINIDDRQNKANFKAPDSSQRPMRQVQRPESQPRSRSRSTSRQRETKRQPESKISSHTVGTA